VSAHSRVTGRARTAGPRNRGSRLVRATSCSRGPGRPPCAPDPAERERWATRKCSCDSPPAKSDNSRGSRPFVDGLKLGRAHTWVEPAHRQLAIGVSIRAGRHGPPLRRRQRTAWAPRPRPIKALSVATRSDAGHSNSRPDVTKQNETSPCPVQEVTNGKRIRFALIPPAKHCIMHYSCIVPSVLCRESCLSVCPRIHVGRIDGDSRSSNRRERRVGSSCAFAPC